MSHSIKLLAILFFAAFGANAQTITGGFVHDGISRNYRLHLPPNFDAGEKLPLVFNLHGYTSTGQQQELYSGMNAVADTARFLVCYPDGIGNAWNIGVAGGSTADDLGFIAAMIDSFSLQYGIDLERVYSCGMSNGGFLSYRLACEMGDRIAAIASVTGSMTTAMLDGCVPLRPMPVLEIHGNADPVVAFNGATGIASVPDVTAFWAAQNNCGGPIASGNFPDTAPNDQATASFSIHTGCEEGAEVILTTIDNGGHTWPGAFPTVVFGATCQDFNASVEIWNFFNRFKLELPSATGEATLELPEITVFPNPFSDELNIGLVNAAVATARVFDGFGRLVWSGNPAEGLRTADWPTGLYFMEVKMGGQVSVRKVVKR